jgi:hypothetical protein
MRFTVVRGFIPDGLRSRSGFSESKEGPLRDPSGINPLTTDEFPHTDELPHHKGLFLMGNCFFNRRSVNQVS